MAIDLCVVAAAAIGTYFIRFDFLVSTVPPTGEAGLMAPTRFQL